MLLVFLMPRYTRMDIILYIKTYVLEYFITIPTGIEGCGHPHRPGELCRNVWLRVLVVSSQPTNCPAARVSD